jgi:ATP/maltotriose-dependent transcriptional regulator MalT
VETAEHHFQRALEVGRTLGNLQLEAIALNGLSNVLLDRGDLAQARELREQSLVLYERKKDYWIISFILWGLARVALAQKDYDRTGSALHEWARIARELGNRWALSYIIELRAELALDTDQLQQAACLFGAAEALRQHQGTRFSASESAQHEASLARLRQLLPDKELAQEWEKGRASASWDLINEA